MHLPCAVVNIPELYIANLHFAPIFLGKNVKKFKDSIKTPAILKQSIRVCVCRRFLFNVFTVNGFTILVTKNIFKSPDQIYCFNN